MLNKCLITLAILIITITALGSLFIGFKLGRQSICGDIAFYYHNDLPVNGCVEKNINKESK